MTAENERWYLEGQPITFQGGLYYPAGAPVFFNGNEMARTGDYLGVPLYLLATARLRTASSTCRSPAG